MHHIGLSAEYIDALQGRSKNTLHQTYIKTNPEELRKIYMKDMKNIIVLEEKEKTEIKKGYTYNNQYILSDTS